MKLDKIAAIKMVRLLCLTGLREAKDFVDEKMNDYTYPIEIHTYEDLAIILRRVGEKFGPLSSAHPDYVTLKIDTLSYDTLIALLQAEDTTTAINGGASEMNVRLTAECLRRDTLLHFVWKMNQRD